MNQYSDKECLEAIQYIKNKVGKSPSIKDYRKHKLDEHPNSSIFSHRFGSWNNAKEKAGLDIHNHNSCNKKECLEALKYVSDKIEKNNISKREYDKHKKDTHLTSFAVIKKFDSWNNAKEKAELKINYNTYKQYTKQDYFDAIVYVSNKLNKSPTKNEYTKHKKESHPSIYCIQENIGWNNAKKQISLETYNDRC